jgi:hypothetical protein
MGLVAMTPTSVLLFFVLHTQGRLYRLLVHRDVTAVTPTELLVLLHVLLHVLHTQGRLYRLLDAFGYVEYRMLVGQLALMLARNLLYVFLLMHWAACAFFLAAKWVVQYKLYSTMLCICSCCSYCTCSCSCTGPRVRSSWLQSGWCSTSFTVQCFVCVSVVPIVRVPAHALGRVCVLPGGTVGGGRAENQLMMGAWQGCQELAQVAECHERAGVRAVGPWSDALLIWVSSGTSQPCLPAQSTHLIVVRSIQRLQVQACIKTRFCL